MSFKQQIASILGSDIHINLIRVIKLKKISIKISNNCINIKSPFFLPKKSTEQLINKKINWIKKQFFIQSKIQSFKRKIYVNDEIFLYLGENYKLKIIISKKYSVKIESNYLIVNLKDKLNTSKLKKIIKEWMYERSDTYLKEQTYYFAKKNDLSINSIKVRDYKARWGSCSINGDISFNWRLIMAPPKIIEYVIFHELMHLKEHNHSPKYWDHVKELYPQIKEAKEWLMRNGQTLNI